MESRKVFFVAHLGKSYSGRLAVLPCFDCRLAVFGPRPSFFLDDFQVEYLFKRVPLNHHLEDLERS